MQKTYAIIIVICSLFVSSLFATDITPLKTISAGLLPASVMPLSQFLQAPYVVGQRADKLYVRGLSAKPGMQYVILHRGRRFLDPQTNQALGIATDYRATATVLQTGEVAVLRLLNVSKPLDNGDRLFSLDRINTTMDLPPRVAKQKTNVQIIAILQHAAVGKSHTIVALNYGSAQGARSGQVLNIVRIQTLLVNEFIHSDTAAKLARKKIGRLKLLCSFTKVSFAMVLQAKQNVRVLDHAIVV